MISIILVQLIALIVRNHDLRRSEDNTVEYIPTPDGPQTLEEAVLTHQALHGDKFGGDMILPKNISNAGMKDEKYRWHGFPGGAEIPYVIEESLSDHEDLILRGMEAFHDHTCIKFVPRTDQDDYIRIYAGKGCNAAIGMHGGAQPLSLGPKCYYIGLVIHELGHAVGLFHEHQRSDRSKYVNILYKNILPGDLAQFDTIHPGMEFKNTPYDYDSIMHYGNYAFSKKKNVLVTMVAKTGQKLLDPFEKSGFTASDVHLINSMYKCDTA